MDALIMTCGTGGGHNAAAEAIREEMERRGDRAEVLNPYALISERRVRQIDGAYVSLAQKAPKGFGVVYRLGELYRRTGHRSPVYFLNRRAALALEEYLSAHSFDVVLYPHLFPGEVITQMKDRGRKTPKSIFIATDYTCIPFTEEIRCDAYVIPSAELAGEYTARGIPGEKLHPLGIPVRRAFLKGETREQARAALGLDREGRYFLLSGGSMGAGYLRETVELLGQKSGARLAVICGSNKRLYRELESQYGDEVLLLRSTGQMASWLRACDVYFTKPGGLSSTEAAVVGTRLVHLPPIPGCETANARFFQDRGMSIPFQGEDRWERLNSLLEDHRVWETMAENQRRTVPPDAAERIWALARALVGGEG